MRSGSYRRTEQDTRPVESAPMNVAFLLTPLRVSALLVAGVLLVLPGCGTERSAEAGTPPPLEGCEDPFACAGRTKLAKVAPTDRDDLHNVFRLSEHIISGGEPLSDDALAHIKSLGIKTILSVDGKAPNAALAKKLGMRYVHVPIRYGGMTATQLLKVAKTFRELEAPFFVHCFHGKHRGPAAAAVGRLILDGAGRELALAEMRQWCGTAEKYPGLYATIATGAIPTKAQTDAFDWDFPSTDPIKGIRLGMVRMTRTFDNVKAIAQNGWKPDAAHPDIDPVNEVKMLRQHFDQMAALADTKKRPKDYRAWMVDSQKLAVQLVGSVQETVRGKAGAGPLADKQLKVLKDLCQRCHEPYRNK